MTYAQQAQALYDAPLVHPETLPGQKFPIGTTVYIINPQTWYSKKESSKTAFEVECTYAQKYWGNDVDSYSLINKETGCKSAWYYESELSLVMGENENSNTESKEDLFFQNLIPNIDDMVEFIKKEFSKPSPTSHSPEQE